MSFKHFSLTRSRSKLLILLPPLTFLFLMMTNTGTPPTVHSAAFSQETGERQFRIERRSDHPIAIKQIRNAQSERFLHDVEVEIQNVGNKPVYFVYLYIRFPDIEVMPNVHYANTLIYGDPRLSQAAQLPGPQDQSIPPGGTVTLTVSKGEWSGFEWYQHEKQLPRAATNLVEIYLKEVNFGDGTNYEWDKPERRPRPS
ncbi:MAG TPA: hypothetical protein VJZ91_15275 [Blastocatellia bacterium]|nr:hypothetical protein [Blastocatellia bacterium]